jgi:acyl-CoA dehydrogenase
MALELACERAVTRTAFGKPIANLGGNRERIADARMAIQQARLLVLHAAWLLDTEGLLGALSAISQIKVVVPNTAQQVVDMAIQLHGGAGPVAGLPARPAWLVARACASPTARRGAPRGRGQDRARALPAAGRGELMWLLRLTRLGRTE